VKPEELERKMTLGFKLMSGYYLNAVARDNISVLVERADIPWGSLALEKTLNAVGEELLENNHFKIFQSWRIPIIDVLSDAIAVNFLLVMAKDWERKGGPRNRHSAEHREFQKNGIILLDRSVFEYVTNKWRGSSDSRIASNLNSINTTNALFDPVPNDAWAKLIDEVIDEGKIDGRSYLRDSEKHGDRRLRGLLLYYYVLKGISGPSGVGVQSDIDHIIPRSLFMQTPSEELKKWCHSLANLALIPKKPNISKGDKPIDQVLDSWLRSQIQIYEEIPQEEFRSFSSVTQVTSLKDFRGAMFKDVFKKARPGLIEN